MDIEVVWKAKPASGITNIELLDLNCETREEWEKLSEDEQRKRIDNYLSESDVIVAKAIEW